jgi:hypothetical protein
MSGRKIQVSTELKLFKGDRDAVRRKTVRTAMAGILSR